MSDGLGILNWIRLRRVDHGLENQEKLDDLRYASARIARVTGDEPQSWQEFKLNHPATPVDVGGRAAVTAAIGAAIGFIGGALFSFAVVPLALAGAALGGIMSVSDHKNQKNDDLIKDYGAYLSGFEHAREPGKGKSRDDEMSNSRRTSHASELAAERREADNTRHRG